METTTQEWRTVGDVRIQSFGKLAGVLRRVAECLVENNPDLSDWEWRQYDHQTYDGDFMVRVVSIALEGEVGGIAVVQHWGNVEHYLIDGEVTKEVAEKIGLWLRQPYE